MLVEFEQNGMVWTIKYFVLFDPGGVSLHMTGYAPTYTKSVEKGSFLTYNVLDVFCKKGIFFAANRTLGVPEWVEIFTV